MAARKSAIQLDLFAPTAEQPKGTTKSNSELPAMTIAEVASYENLKRAFQQVARNKGAAGPDGQSIAEVRKQLDGILRRLHKTLTQGNYTPGAIRRVWIPKSDGSQRGLGIPNVTDRIVQQAVHQVLSPHYETTFHGSSHGFRPGRSCHTAVMEACAYIGEGYQWAVDLDLEKFFDQVNHQRLVARLEQQIQDGDLVHLIHSMLTAKTVMPDGVVVVTEEGTPQGGPLSPLLSNIVLDELDDELSQRGHRFVRYADDCTIYVKSERAGQRVMASITRFIERRLRLKVNRAKSAIANPVERHFLGFVLERSGKKVIVRPSPRTLMRLKTRIRELTKRNRGQRMAVIVQRLNRFLRGWSNFFQLCSGHVLPFLGTMDSHIRRRLRAIQLRHWRRRRTIAKRLIRRGAPHRGAWRAVYRQHRGWWALSNHPVVTQALPNVFFAELGLQSLEQLWRELNRKWTRPYALRG